jgi:hypothetical protein
VRLPLVYIAGPITKPCPMENARQGMAMFDLLLATGWCVPFCPHLSVFHHIYSPKSHAEWLAYDFQIISHCDALYRMPGESVGADKEEEFCEQEGIPVFDTLESLQTFCEDWVREFGHA